MGCLIPLPRVETHRTLKQAYVLRSRIVHGDVVGLERERIVDLSIACDTLLRKSFGRFIEDIEIERVFDGDTQHVDKYFLYLVMDSGGIHERAGEMNP